MNEEVKVALNAIWLLLGTCLVFWMQAGFAMVETGFTRAKNAGNIIMKNLLDFAVGSVIYWLLGFGLMFGDSIGGFVGIPTLLDSFSGELDFVWFIFQTVFCATAATIVSGAMAERTKFSSYLIYSAFISAIIYPVVGHWIWGGGFLSQLGFHDYAGSTVVHSVGGWCALVGAAILGPRIGKYTKEGKVNAIPGHSLTLGALGVFILWMGWFGFNPASSADGTNVLLNGRVFVTTNMAAVVATITTMSFTWIKYGKPDVSMTLNGALAGLVGVTAGCDVVSVWGAAAIGLICGIVVVVVIEVIDKKFKIDDPVGAIGVHCGCGVTGTICTGLFAVEGGLFYGGGFHLLGVQLLGTACVAIWTLLCITILFTIIKKAIGLRVSTEEEIGGLDLYEHGLTSSYGDFQIKE
ncbi:MAG: ammonium transporter [Cellulosilyticum sp.]|nr:ammonium transporter [Cellulosilyticum sp.]